jgi:SAM-dependent methyltransferase
MRTICPACNATGCEIFYEVSAVPTNSCLLIDRREDALRFPTGDIRMCFCDRCGFIFNGAWEPGRTIYSEAYEETQGYSPTFNAFSRQLAESLIARHDLHGRDVLEIGCGKGEFLALLCQLGPNRGVGYDPSFVPARLDPEVADRVRCIQDFFTEDTVVSGGDFICCKMTLEHIRDVGSFVRAARRAAEDHKAVTFFQIPNADYILDDCAFWDIYYEHISYFTPGSLARLFRLAGFEVMDVWTGYDDQYLMIEARPGAPNAQAIDREDVTALKRRVDGFAERARRVRAAWLERLRAGAADGRKTVLWGSGSKAVSFLTTLGIGPEVDCVVDINPHRWGRYLPVTGHRIVSPAELVKLQPDRVVIMNPIYWNEIARDLDRLGCRTELTTV